MYDLVGIGGDSHSVICYVINAMQEMNFEKDEINDYLHKALTSDYNNMLSASVEIIEKINSKLNSEPKTLFEIHQRETIMDDDYDNDIVIDETGRIVVKQRSTYMYEPTTVTSIRYAEEYVLNDIKEVLEKYKDYISQLQDEEWDDSFYVFRLKILEKKIDARCMNADSPGAIILINFRLILDYYYPGLVNWKYIFNSCSLQKEYDEIIEAIKKI